MAEQPENRDQLTPEQQALHDKLEAAARERSPIDPNQSDEAKRAAFLGVKIDEARGRAFADIVAREVAAAEARANRQDAIAATGFYCPTEAEIAQGYATVSEVTPLPPPMCGEEFTPRGSDYMIRVVCERERGHDGYHGTVPVTEGGTAIGDPTTAAIEQQNRERDRMRDAIARARTVLSPLVPSAPDDSIETLAHAVASRLGYFIRERKRAVRERDDWKRLHKGNPPPNGAAANEIAQLRRQVDELTRQRDEIENRHRVTEDRLEMFVCATAEMAIERLRMVREREAAPPMVRDLRVEAEHALALAEANRECARRRLRFDECEAACWEAIETVRDAGVGFWSERNVDVEHAVTRTIEGLAKLLADTREQLRVADADRVPLRMDLDAMRAELARANACALRMEPVTKAAEKAAAIWNGSKVASIPSPLIAALCELSDADKAYGEACKQAESAGADPGSDAMPF